MDKEQLHIDNLIDGCKRNDRKSQGQLYNYFYNAMMNLCVRYTKNEADAESVLNAGFFRVFKSISNYDPSKGSVYTWIRTIVVNACLYHIRSDQKIADKQLDEVDDVHLEPGIELAMNEKEILDLIRELPSTTQAVFNLYIIDGYMHKEIAGLLQMSVGTSKWHLNEARKKLKLKIIQKGITK